MHFFEVICRSWKMWWDFFRVHNKLWYALQGDASYIFSPTDLRNGQCISLPESIKKLCHLKNWKKSHYVKLLTENICKIRSEIMQYLAALEYILNNCYVPASKLVYLYSKICISYYHYWLDSVDRDIANRVF